VNAAVRLAGFAAALTVVLGAGYAAGAALDRSPAATGPAETSEAAHGVHRAAEPKSAVASGDVAGLAATEHGYTLRLSSARLPAGPAVPVRFTIAGPDGSAVTSYDVEHEKELHFIAVRRDFTGYQHVHPTRDAAGVWSTSLDLRPGSWRLFADFLPGDGAAPAGLTLGSDLEVAGNYVPAPAARPTTTAQVGDLAVALTGSPRAGMTTDLGFTLTRAGQQVVPEPYLGVRGHLVALREGDLAYLHVHPDEDALSFATAFPAPGRYRLFLDVKVDDAVRTAAFTVGVEQ
jgi:hypothetical protein